MEQQYHHDVEMKQDSLIELGAKYIKERLNDKFAERGDMATNSNYEHLPSIAVICGSGLSELYKSIEVLLTVPYKDIPGFIETGVQGHVGELVFGYVDPSDINATEPSRKALVVMMRGRFHSYEGHDMKVVTMPVRLFHVLGVKTLIVTNAAGGINIDFEVGDVMIISDHIGFPLLAGKHPLVGPNNEKYGPRFPPMSNAYDPGLRKGMVESAKKLNMYGKFIRPYGTYACVSGPNYETKAEVSMLRLVGADAVGMSTVPEVTVARHCGMKVIGLSLITNKARLPGDKGIPASHEEVLGITAYRANDLISLVGEFMKQLAAGKNWDNEVEGSEIDIDHIQAGKAEVGPSASATATANEITKRLSELDFSKVTPLKALDILQELKNLAASAAKNA